MSEKNMKKLAVIGAGNMGSGIAQKMASEGFDVTLVDLDDEKVQRGLGIIRNTLAEGVERKIFGADQAEAIQSRIRGTANWDDLADVDLVVEAVFEDLGVKRNVFERLEEVCRADAILATNTSSFLVSDFCDSAKHPERVLGLHYFYHPAKNRLVEVVAGNKTSQAATDAAWTLQELIGKTPIASADASGFVVNRFFVPWLNEAVRLLEDGVADIPTIEWAAKKTFRIGMGPFELTRRSNRVNCGTSAARPTSQSSRPSPTACSAPCFTSPPSLLVSTSARSRTPTSAPVSVCAGPRARSR
jgi:enoyl-CoA hydratase/3-hydroxyacyl-CoA dehydrogenase